MDDVAHPLLLNGAADDKRMRGVTAEKSCRNSGPTLLIPITPSDCCPEPMPPLAVVNLEETVSYFAALSK